MPHVRLLLQVLCSQAEIQSCCLIGGSAEDRYTSRIPHVVGRTHFFVSELRFPFLSRSFLLFIGRPLKSCLPHELLEHGWLLYDSLLLQGH